MKWAYPNFMKHMKKPQHIPNLSSKSTTPANPTVLSSNLKIRPQQTLHHRKKHKWRAYNNLCNKSKVNPFIQSHKKFRIYQYKKQNLIHAYLYIPTTSSGGTSASFKTVTIFFTSSRVPFCNKIKPKTKSLLYSI